jgi:hypothetical protein
LLGSNEFAEYREVLAFRRPDRNRWDALLLRVVQSSI